MKNGRILNLYPRIKQIQLITQQSYFTFYLIFLSIFQNVPVCFQHFKTSWIFHGILPPIWADMNLGSIIYALLSTHSTRHTHLLLWTSELKSCWNFLFFRNNEFWQAKIKSQRRKLFKELSDSQTVIFVDDDHDCNLDDY